MGSVEKVKIRWEDPFGGCKTNNFEPQPGNSYTSYTLKSDKKGIICLLPLGNLSLSECQFFIPFLIPRVVGFSYSAVNYK